MIGEQAVLYVLQSDATYGELVGGVGSKARVYYDEATQGKAYPLAVVSDQGLSDGDTKSDWGEFDTQTIQLLNCALDKKTANDMAVRARVALNYIAEGTYNGCNVISMQLIDADSFTERIIDKKIFVKEQLFKVITKK